MKLIIFLACVLGSHAALADNDNDKEVEVAAAPPIATQPGSGLDPDLAKRLDDAHAVASRSASAAELTAALDRTLVLYQSDDPFSRAQRDAAKARAVAVLTQIGTRARDAGALVVAARAFDARWTVQGGKATDAELADVLTAWAEREAAAAPGRALYLARRARRADPADGRAAELDDDLSSNRRAVPGKLAVLAGVLAFGAGLYAQYKDHDKLATGLYIASPVLQVGGILFVLSGSPNHSPVSPAELPAL